MIRLGEEGGESPSEENKQDLEDLIQELEAKLAGGHTFSKEEEEMGEKLSKAVEEFIEFEETPELTEKLSSYRNYGKIAVAATTRGAPIRMMSALIPLLIIAYKAGNLAVIRDLTNDKVGDFLVE